MDDVKTTPASPPKEIMLAVRKMQAEMALFLGEKAADFQRTFPSETELLATSAGEAMLLDSMEDLQDAESWSLDDLTNLSAVAYLLAVACHVKEGKNDAHVRG